MISPEVWIILIFRIFSEFILHQCWTICVRAMQFHVYMLKDTDGLTPFFLSGWSLLENDSRDQVWGRVGMFFIWFMTTKQHIQLSSHCYITVMSPVCDQWQINNTCNWIMFILSIRFLWAHHPHWRVDISVSYRGIHRREDEKEVFVLIQQSVLESRVCSRSITEKHSSLTGQSCWKSVLLQHILWQSDPPPHLQHHIHWTSRS